MPAISPGGRDKALYERLLRGEESGLAELYDQFSALIFGIAKRVTRDHTAAEDIVQEVVVRFWERPHAFDPAKGSLRAWLATLAHRRAVDWVRREIRRQHLLERAPSVHEEPSAEEAVVDADTAARVRRALQMLPSAQREVVELAYFHERSYRQVANDLGVPEGTVKSRMRMALHKLAAAVATEEGW
jgi:RNA polymerase sigma-70 factor (ECF subfamily)